MANDTIKIIQNPFDFEHLVDKTEELALLAVSTNPDALRVVPKEFQTKHVCLVALKLNPLVLIHIHNPFKDYYNVAICYTKKPEHLHELLDMIPQLECDLNVLNKISEVSAPLEYKNWFKKFNVLIWSETIINSLTSNGKTCRSMIEFLLENRIEITKNQRKRIVQQCIFGEYCLQLLSERDIKSYYKNDRNSTVNIPDQLASTIELTIPDFHKFYNKIAALELCKTPTYGMIILCAIRGCTWSTISCCLKKNLLTGQTLSDIINLVPNKLINEQGASNRINNKPVYGKIITLNQVLDLERIEQLKNIDLTIDQLNEMQKNSELLYEYLKNYNVNVQTFSKVVIMNHVTEKNYEKKFWNFKIELDSLIKENDQPITYKVSKKTYKFYSNGALIRSVIVLN